MSVKGVQNLLLQTKRDLSNSVQDVFQQTKRYL